MVSFVFWVNCGFVTSEVQCSDIYIVHSAGKPRPSHPWPTHDVSSREHQPEFEFHWWMLTKPRQRDQPCRQTFRPRVSSLYSNCIHFRRVSNQYSNIRAYSYAFWYRVANDCMFTKVLQHIQASNIAPCEDPRPPDIVPQTRIRPYPPLTSELIGAFNCFAISSFPHFVTWYH